MQISDTKLSDASISLDEFCACVAEKLDRKEDFWECRYELQKLSNNKSIVLDHIHNVLKGLWKETENKQDDIQYVQSAFSIRKHDFGNHQSFRIRALYWDTISSSVHTNRLFVYDDIPHSHNFELLTIGHAGPGYHTTLWTYDDTKISGRVGEAVDMHYLGRYTLKQDCMIYYQQNHDIHMQHAPELPSVSLNLIYVPNPHNRQYFFDHKQQKIHAVLPSAIDDHHALFTFASYLGNADTVDILTELLKHKAIQSPENKAAAEHALKSIRF